MAQFKVGKEYKTRSIGDYNCIFTILITGRTAKTVSYNYLGRSRRSMVHVDRMANGSSRTGTAWPHVPSQPHSMTQKPPAIAGASLLPPLPPCGRILAGKGGDKIGSGTFDL